MKYKASTYEYRAITAARKVAIFMDGKSVCYRTNGVLHPVLSHHLDTIRRNLELAKIQRNLELAKQAKEKA